MRMWKSALVLTLAIGMTVPAPVAADPPPLPDPEPDYTLIGDLALCGVIRLGTLTIPASRTLRVATEPDPAVVIPSRAGDPPKQNCPAASVGSLRIEANRIINNGTIDASGTQPVPVDPSADPPSGNGGGAHHGAGGDGSTGTGGEAYTDPDNRLSATTEPGAPGAGTAKGLGGGSLVLVARQRPVRLDPDDPTITYVDGQIVSTGPMRVNGIQGRSDTSGTCGQPDGSVAFAGVHAPGGGGAGGGIVLDAVRLELSGQLSARGGQGGFGRAGGGGGGGGGVVKLIAPIQILTGAFGVDVAGGTPGGACTVGNLPNPAPVPGEQGQPGDRVDVATPQATAHDPASFWNSGTVRVPVSAAGSYSGSSPSGFTVYVCGIRSSTSAPPAVPTANSAAGPCGTGLAPLATKAFAGVFAVQPGDAGAFVDLPLGDAADDGYWGVWAAIVRGAAVSDPPATVHTVFGVDNTAPAVTITSPAANFVTSGPDVVLDFDQSDPDAAGVPSGIAATECRNELPAASPYAPCVPGQVFALTPGYGAKRIGVRVTDVVGNLTERTVSGSFANAPPAVAADRASVTVAEGTLASMTGTVADREAVSLGASIGTIVAGPGGTWSWSYQSTEGPADSQQVTITATDSLGLAGQARFDLVVANVAPSVALTGPPAGARYAVGVPVPVSASFTDPGTADTHTATVSWGDGETSPVPATAGAVTAEHRYAVPGEYLVTVTVLDDDGGTGVASRAVIVTKAPTALSAEPAVARIGPGITVNLLNLKARLIRSDTGAPLAGQTVTMTVPRLIGGTPITVCTAVTGADGRASCNGTANVLQIVLNAGYRANYAGTVAYLPSTARGSLVS